MSYYLFAGKCEIDFESVKTYILKTDKYKRYAIFVINSNNLFNFFNCVDYETVIKKYDVKKLYLIGDDGGLYYFDGKEVIKENDKSPITINSNWKRLKKLSKQVNKDEEYCNQNKSKTDFGIISTAKSTTGFDKYVFVDKSNNIVIPFRYRKSKKHKQPLVVYFSGAGTLGHDNYKPLFEFLFFASGKKLINKDCNILIPQSMLGKNETEEILLNKYTNACAEIVKMFANEDEIDNKKIYAFGTSLGGKCVWHALLGNPHLYTAVVETMGLMHNYQNADINSISHIPIWIAHSNNDDCVSIDSDDYCYNELKSLNADVKYTRWEKHGHKMARKFYRQENWVQWLFSKSK